MRTPSPALAIFMTFLLVACNSETSLPEKKTETLARPAKLIEVGQANNNDFLNYTNHNIFTYKLYGVIICYLYNL